MKKGPGIAGALLVFSLGLEIVLHSVSIGHRRKIKHLLNVCGMAEAGFQVLATTAGLNEPHVVGLHRLNLDFHPGARFGVAAGRSDRGPVAARSA